MNLAFILDPLDSLKIYKDTSYAILREAFKRGHSVFIMQQHDIFLKDQKVFACFQQLHLKEGSTPWYQLEEEKIIPLNEFDIVLMRKDPPFDTEYLYSTYLLELAQAQGAKVFNHAQALRDHNEKLAILRFPELIPATLVTSQAENIHRFLNEQHDIILKPLDAMGGQSIFRLRQGDVNTNVVIETMTKNNSRTIMIQRYLPEIVSGDKRVLLIAGQAVPYALVRMPKAGETRANLAAGGQGVIKELTQRDRDIAQNVGPQLYKQGLLLVGLDIIGDCLTEINVTSPTGFQEITQATKLNVAGMMLDALEQETQK